MTKLYSLTFSLLRRAICLSLALSLVIPDPLAASGMVSGTTNHPGRTPLSSNIFQAQAFIPRLASRFLPDNLNRRLAVHQIRNYSKTQQVRTTRRGIRKLAGVAAAGALILQTAIPPILAQTAPPTTRAVSLEEARYFRNLMARFVQTNPKIEEALAKVDAAEKHMQAMSARNESVALEFQDPRIPRIPLGNSPFTPGPLNPSIADVIGRASHEVEGPVRTVESLRRKETGFWGQIWGDVKTLATTGGFTFNSDSVRARSEADAIVAKHDAAIEATQPLIIAEAQWLALQDKWFDLQMADTNLRRLEMQDRFQQKQVAVHQANLPRAVQGADRVATQNQITTLIAAIGNGKQDYIRARGLRDKLAAEIVREIRGQDSDKSTLAAALEYRPYVPRVQPTLELVSQVLLSSGYVIDRQMLVNFRDKLRSRLRLANAEIPQDPFDPRTRALLAQTWLRAWEGPTRLDSAARDDEFPIHFAQAQEILGLAEKDRLLSVQAAPEQAALYARAQRSLQVAEIYKIDKLRSWSINLFIRLGLDLPIQPSVRVQQPMSTERANKLIEKESDLRRSIEAALNDSIDSNDSAIQTAGIELRTAWQGLEQASRQSVLLLSGIPNEVTVSIQGVSNTNRVTQPIWDVPVVEFEKSVYQIEERGLALEKAYQRVNYLLNGRLELQLLLEAQREARRTSSDSIQNSTPNQPLKRQDLALPQTKKSASANLIKTASVATVLGFFAFLPPAVFAATDSMVGAVGIQVPAIVEWLMSGVVLALIAFLPIIRRLRFKAESEEWFKWWALGIFTVGILFPYGFLAGIAAGVVAAGTGWWVSPESLTWHRPSGVFDRIAHSIYNRKFYKTTIWYVSLFTIVLWSFFPVKQFVDFMWNRGTEIFLSRGVTNSAAGYQLLHWPIRYTPPQNGKLVRVNVSSDTDVLKHPYLVRWIDSNTNPDSITNAAFVFQMQPGSTTFDDEVNEAEQDIQLARARLQQAQSAGRLAGVSQAEIALRRANANLEAAYRKISLWDEPMPPGIEIVPTLPSAIPNQTVYAGTSLTLTHQKSSRSVKLRLSLTREQAITIGEGVTQPGRRLRMRFTTGDSAREIVIPTAAIRDLKEATNRRPATSPRTTNQARGGIPILAMDADILITSDLLTLKDIADFVPADTLTYVSRVNSVNPGAGENLDLAGFDEWKDGKWVPYARPQLAPNEVVAFATLLAPEASRPRGSLPEQVATINAEPVRENIANLTSALQDLRAQRDALPPDTTEGELERLSLTRDITELEEEIDVARQQLSRAASGIQMTSEADIAIGPREFKKEAGGRLIFATDPIARLLNPWTQRHVPARASTETSLNDSVMNWDPHSLRQVQEGRATVHVKTALQSIRQMSEGPWMVVFPSGDTVEFSDPVNSQINDTVQDLSETGLMRRLSIGEVQRLMPLPGATLPVALRLTGAVADGMALAAPPEVAPEPNLLSDIRENWFPLTGATLALVIVGFISGWAMGWRMKALKRARLRLVTKPTTDTRPAAPPAAVELANKRTDNIPKLKLSPSVLQRLAKQLGDTYIHEEHRDSEGTLLDTPELLVKRFGLSVILPETAKLIFSYWKYQQSRNAPNSRVVQLLFIVPLFLIATAAIFIAGTIIGTAILVGDATLDIIRGNIDLRVFVLENLYSRPRDILFAGSVVTVMIMLIGSRIYTACVLAGQYVAALGRVFWGLSLKLRGADTAMREFSNAGREWHPEKRNLNPDIEIRRLLNPVKYDYLIDSERDEEHTSAQLMEILHPFGHLIVTRAAANLHAQSIAYLSESPLDLDAKGNFFTTGRRVASNARWWTEICLTTTQDAGTPRGLIPPGDMDSPDQQYKYNPETIRQIAIQKLGMDESKIRREIESRVNPDQVEERVARVIQEYMDRAHVQWAIREMPNRWLTSLIALDAYDLLGLAFDNTDRKSAVRRLRQIEKELLELKHSHEVLKTPDQRTRLARLKALSEESNELKDVIKSHKEFDTMRGDVDHTLDVFHMRLPTLFPQAFAIREKYTRETRMFQLIRYLQGKYGVNDLDVDDPEEAKPTSSFSESWSDRLNHYLINPDTGKSILRDRTIHDIPTFIAIAKEYYETGQWPPLLTEVQQAYESKLGYAPRTVADQIARIKRILHMQPTRRFIAWLIVRLLRKSIPDNFDRLYTDFSSTPNRNPYDLRFLKDLAPVKDIHDQSVTTNADLFIAELQYRRLIEMAMDYTDKPLFGDIDWYTDLAFDINPREGAQDAAFIADMIGGSANLLAMNESSDPYATELGLRMSTRIPEEKATRVRVRNSMQTTQLLPTAGQARPGSVLEISPEPDRSDIAFDPRKTDDKLFILSAPNLYLKYAARLIFFSRVLEESERKKILARMPPAQRILFEKELRDIEPTLARMNVGVKIYKKWHPDILEKDVPAENDDHSYNTILIVYPGARPPRFRLHESATFDKTTGSLRRVQGLGADSIALIGQTLWGEGGTGAHYYVREGESLFPSLKRDHWELRDPETSRLLGYRFSMQLPVSIQGTKIPAIYHTWTTTDAAVRGQKAARFLHSKTVERFRKALKGKGIVLCKMEADNLPSLRNIADWKDSEGHQYLQIGKGQTGYIARRRPRAGTPGLFSKAEPEGRAQIQALLQNNYQGYALTDFDQAVRDSADGYYVWREHAGGPIVAVVWAKRQHWVLEQLKNFASYLGPVVDRSAWLKRVAEELNKGFNFVLIKFVLPFTPYLKKVFNLGDLKFVLVADIGYAPGQAQTALRLIEAVLAEKKSNGALGFFDDSGPVYHELKKAGAFGLTGVLDQLQNTEIKTFAYALDPENRELVKELNKPFIQEKGGASRGPLYISARTALSWLMAVGTATFGYLGLASLSIAGTVSQNSALQQATVQAVKTVLPHAIRFNPGESTIGELVLRLRGSDDPVLREFLKGDLWGIDGAVNRFWNAFGVQSQTGHVGKVFSNESFDVSRLYETVATAPTWVPPTPPAITIETLLPPTPDLGLSQLFTPELAGVFAAALVLTALGVWAWRTFNKSNRLSWRPLLKPIAVGLLGLNLLAFVSPAFSAPQRGTVQSTAPRTPQPPPDFTRLDLPSLGISEPVAPAQVQNQKAPESPVAVPAHIPQPIEVVPDEKELRPWVDYVNARLADASAARAAADPRSLVEALRQQYLALYAERHVESLTDDPLRPPTMPPSPKRGFWKGSLRAMGQAASGVAKVTVIPVAKGIAKPFKTSTSVRADVFDPQLNALRKQVEDLVRSAKRDQALAQMDLDAARKANEDLATYQRAVDSADQRAEMIRQALSEVQVVPDLPEEKSFENEYAAVWEEIGAGTSRLPEDLLAIQRAALNTNDPVAGTLEMKSSEKQVALGVAHALAQKEYYSDLGPRSSAAAAVDQRLSLAQHLRFIGMDPEATQIEHEALRVAQRSGILPGGRVIFRSEKFASHLDDLYPMAMRYPDIAVFLQPYLSESRNAEGALKGLVENSVTTSLVRWKWAIGNAQGENPRQMFPEEYVQVFRILQEETEARIKIQATNNVLAALIKHFPNEISLRVSRLPEVENAGPTDVVLQAYELDVARSSIKPFVRRTVEENNYASDPQIVPVAQVAIPQPRTSVWFPRNPDPKPNPSPAPLEQTKPVEQPKPAVTIAPPIPLLSEPKVVKAPAVRQPSVLSRWSFPAFILSLLGIPAAFWWLRKEKQRAMSRRHLGAA